jgi:hypothetical protein
MNKKMLSIVLGAVLVGCFFLPYFSFFGMGISGFDTVFKGGADGSWEKYVLLLIPISGVMLLVGALNNGNYIGGRAIWCWLPLLTVLFWIIRLVVEGAPFGDLFKLFGVGFYITIAAAIVAAFYNPKD